MYSMLHSCKVNSKVDRFEFLKSTYVPYVLYMYHEYVRTLNNHIFLNDDE